MQEYESYESFAQVYDELMDNVPYDEWAEFYYGISDGQRKASSAVYGVGKRGILGTGAMAVHEILSKLIRWVIC